MLEAWRIIKTQHSATAFSGEGAAKFSGRWNSRGVLVIYTSATRSLAALEILVHLNPPIHLSYKIFPIEFSEKWIEQFNPSKLPADWRTEPPPFSTKLLGDLWVREKRSAILALPSIIIPEEINYLLNPAHPDFAKIVVGKPSDFVLDSRLV